MGAKEAAKNNGGGKGGDILVNRQLFVSMEAYATSDGVCDLTAQPSSQGFINGTHMRVFLFIFCIFYFLFTTPFISSLHFEWHLRALCLGNFS